MISATRAAPRVLLLFTEIFANGGIQRFNQTLLSALIDLGAECDLLSMRDSAESISRQTLPQQVTATGYRGRRREFALAIAGRVWRRQYEWILIGHVNLLSMTIAALSAAPWMRARTIMIAHGIEVWYRIGWSRRHALGRLSKILCVSAYTRRRILDQVPGLEPARLRLFPNALGNNWAARFAHRSVAPIHPERFILSVTRLEKGDRYKGVITVIEALSMLEDATLEYRVVGQGNDLGFLKRVAARYGVAHRVHFMSGVTDDELIELYCRCESFVLPSGKEGFGIVFLEAMFFGAPVIAAAEKGALDVVCDGETGLLVRFGDSMAIKRAIERLRSDAALRNHLRETGLRTVENDGPFTYARFVARSAEALEMRADNAA